MEVCDQFHVSSSLSPGKETVKIVYVTVGGGTQ